MHSNLEHYDVLILGGGIFGTYAALYFDRIGQRVLLVDRELAPWKKASLVNQARVHAGYHYPRSIRTARMAIDHRDRFVRENNFAINSSFTQYYGIDKYGTLTSAEQFSRFCKKIGAPLIEISRDDLFSRHRLEALYQATEYSFDPFLLRASYAQRLAESRVTTSFGCDAVTAKVDGHNWQVLLRHASELSQIVAARSVINATYSNINSVNRIFGVLEIPTTHELSEIVLLHSPELASAGLTVMDGPFVSIMPFGLTGLHSLSSVLYTHKAFSGTCDPTFECQTLRTDCKPSSVRSCTDCSARPASNSRKLIRHVSQYLAPGVDLFVHGSFATVKTKLESSFIDDGRPTDIRIYRKNPFYGCIFSGKVNSIYEIERLKIDD